VWKLWVVVDVVEDVGGGDGMEVAVVGIGELWRMSDCDFKFVLEGKSHQMAAIFAA